MKSKGVLIPLTLCLMLLPAAAPGAPGTGALPSRDEMDARWTWDLSVLYTDDAAWERDFETLEKRLPEMEALRGKVGASAADLLTALRLQDELGQTMSRLYVYAHMKSHEDTANPTYQGFAERAVSLAVKAGSAGSFVEPEILAIPEETLADFLSEEKGLEEYRFALARITRMREHVLPAEQELLLARSGGMAQTAETVFSMLTNADLTFPTIRDEDGNEVELSEERYGKYIYSQNRQVRRDAFLGLFTTYGKVRNTLAATLSGSVRKNLFYTQVRKYPSCLDATLFPNAIPVEVYENAVKTVNAHLEPLHRYMRLKKRALGLEELHMYDLYVPLVEETQKDIPYEEALETVRKALAPLGEEYLAELDTAFANRWIDVYENRGKRSGAYSWGTYGVHPFVLLNYKGTLRDTFTIAHEMGHALHSTFTDRNQPFVYSGHAIFTAEVASTTNEALLLDHLIRTSTDAKEKLYLLNYALEQVRTTVYRQLLFAEFELEIHRRAERGEPLTPDVLSSLWRELNLRYYGPDVVVDPELDVEWARIPHFYSAFYVYQYATGLAASTALSRQILSEGAPAMTRYLEFLKSGSSDYPIELLRKAGVDMSAPAPLEATFALFAERLDELEHLLDELEPAK